MKSTTKRAKRLPSSPSRLIKRAAALLLAVCLCAVFTGCDKTVVSTQADTSPDEKNHVSSVSAETLRLGCSGDDSLNPYFMTTDLNTDLISLVFEPLFYADDSFCAVSALALSYKQNSKTLTVRLDTSAAFSDGVQFSSADVVYSFNLAKASQNYQAELATVVSASATAADTVTFTLSGAYRNAADALTFPIVKSGTAQNADSVPLGTGLYRYNTGGELLKLVYNPYCRKPEPNIKTIEVTEIPVSSTLIHVLESGDIDAFFDDLSSGSYSHANAPSTKTNLTNLVFLGMNSASYGLSSTAFRQAVYYAINRQSIVKNSFKNYAVESYTPYHPEWHMITDEKYDLSALTLDYSKAKTLLQNAGFTGKVNLKLIVYTGNNFKVAAAREIQASLQNIGINVTIQELTWENYKLALSGGSYDFYIGEIKLPTDMNLSALFGSGSAVCGIGTADTTAAAYGEYENGNISLAAFTDSFLQNMPFAPICFRHGALVYSDKISPAADCDMGNAYKNIYEWTVSE